MKLTCFDIEATNLNANFGYILCCCFQDVYGKDVKTLAITDYPLFKRDPTNDRQLVSDIYKELVKSDVWFTWYGSRFDVPYINSRLLFHGFSPLPPIPHIDGWRVARNHLKLNSNRLASVAAFLEVEDKTPLSGPIWIRAQAGHIPSINYVIKHCQQDVLVTTQVYQKIRPIIPMHPNVGILNGNKDACPTCGTTGQLQKRGFSVARTTRTQRYQCTCCGSWSRGKPERLEHINVR